MAEAKTTEVKEKAQVKKAAQVALVSRARKPQVFNVAGEDAIHLMPRSTSRAIKAELVNFEMTAAERRGDILVKKL